MWLIVLILALPLVEIGLFVTLGGAIGLWPTLIWVVLAAVLGIIVLKGVASLGPIALSRNLKEFGDPLSPLAHRLLVVLAGGLLLIPGFFTDFIGILLLIPPVRTVAIRLIARRFHVAPLRTGGGPVDLAEGEWREVQDPGAANSDRPPSQWTRH